MNDRTRHERLRRRMRVRCRRRDRRRHVSGHTIRPALDAQCLQRQHEVDRPPAHARQCRSDRPQTEVQGQSHLERSIRLDTRRPLDDAQLRHQSRHDINAVRRLCSRRRYWRHPSHERAGLQPPWLALRRPPRNVELAQRQRARPMRRGERSRWRGFDRSNDEDELADVAGLEQCGVRGAMQRGKDRSRCRRVRVRIDEGQTVGNVEADLIEQKRARRGVRDLYVLVAL